MVTIGLPHRLSLNVSSSSPKRAVVALLAVCLTSAQMPGRSSRTPHAAFQASPAIVPFTRAGDARDSKPQLDWYVGRRPMSFERNVGQTDPRVDFVSRGPGYAVFLAGGEAVFALRGGAPDGEGDGGPATVVRMQLAGAGRPKPIAGDALPGTANYLIGNNPARWHTNIPTYAKVSYADVYPGVDLVYYGDKQVLEYDLLVRPGGDVRRIAVTFEGGGATEIDAQGNLVIRTESGVLRHSRPVVYQQIDDRRHEVRAAYVRRGAREIGFEIGDYDPTRSLVIDPAIVYSTYVGGTGSDAGSAVAIDAAGNAYLLASALSADFPTTAGAFAPRASGGGDRLGRPFEICVSKLDPTGSRLMYSTYLGGSHGADFGSRLAVDAQGRTYVAGFTFADDFPTTPGAFDRTFDGFGTNAFVAKLNETGSALIYSTYLGSDSAAYGLAVDAAGSAYITGTTGPGFPTTPNAVDTSYNGGTDAFVTRLDAAGSALIYSTYLGGSRCNVDGWSQDEGNAIAIDSAGNAYVTGSTTSTDFPTTPNAFHTQLGGLQTCTGQSDAFVTKLDPTGSVLAYSTYLGGAGDFDTGIGIAVDLVGSAYVTGTTNSSDFPTTPGAFDRTPRATGDAFVTRLDPSGSTLRYSTRLGSSDGFDIGYGIVVDAQGRATITGRTHGSTFPTTPDAFDTTIGPGYTFPDTDAFVARLNAAGTALVYSTYLGTGDPEGGTAIAIDVNGDLYVTGYTSSIDFPVTAGAFETTFNGGTSRAGGDAFVAKLSFSDTTPPRMTVSASPHVLWPPNGKLIPVEISGTMSDDSSGINSSTAAFHVIDEYGGVEPAGPVTVAANGKYSFRVLLEASRRSRDHEERRYHVLVTVADRAGNIGSVSDIVTVPLNHGDHQH